MGVKETIYQEAQRMHNNYRILYETADVSNPMKAVYQERMMFWQERRLSLLPPKAKSDV